MNKGPRGRGHVCSSLHPLPLLLLRHLLVCQLRHLRHLMAGLLHHLRPLHQTS